MAPARSSAGDPARSLALLWGEATPGGRRGPKPALEVRRVVAAAVARADADGLEAVSMRGLAAALGVAPMTLYTYVAGKAELLDLMLDAVYTGMERTPTPRARWRRRVAAVADDNRALHAAHPWVARVATARPPLGPGLMAKYEHELGAFAGTGLDDVATDAALTFVLGFVQACAVAEDQVRTAERDTGTTDADWWAANAPLLERVLDPARFPAAVRIGAAVGAAQGAAYDPDAAYAFGLERVLDGLAALIDGAG